MGGGEVQTYLPCLVQKLFLWGVNCGLNSLRTLTSCKSRKPGAPIIRSKDSLQHSSNTQDSLSLHNPSSDCLAQSHHKWGMEIIKGGGNLDAMGRKLTTTKAVFKRDYKSSGIEMFPTNNPSLPQQDLGNLWRERRWE